MKRRDDQSMKEKLIYFDNAATTFPKPVSVPAAVSGCIQRYGGNPGRGSHRLSTLASDLIYACRESASDFFGCEPEQVAFTYSATYALNMAIKGLLHPGAHVLISGMSHNAVYRPVFSAANSASNTAAETDTEQNGISFEVYPHRPGDTAEEILSGIEKMIRPETAMIISTHMANICSAVEPIEQIGALCRQKNIKFVVDGAQSAGHLPMDVKKMNITALCVPGHKGLYGVQGIGMLICGDNETKFSTLIEGGSGINSLDSAMPEILPEHFEAGTPGTPAIAGLLAGLNWVKQVGIEELHEHSAALSSYLWNELSSDPFFTVYGSGDGGVVSFNAEGFSPAAVAQYLSDNGICTRSGYHCAPVAHRSVGSFENGSIRVSFSYMNSVREVNVLLDHLTKLKRQGV